MSLIDAKNFVAPLTRPVHIITILAVAVAFGLFRLLGGGVQVVPNSQRVYPNLRSEQRDYANTQDSEARFDSDVNIGGLGSASGANTSNTATIREESRGNKSSLKSNSKKNSDGTGLDEIEKTLGLR